MRAKDIMTTEVVSVGPDLPVDKAAQILINHRISGLPVLDGRHHLIGIISEGDLMRRTEIGTESRRPWWLQLLAGPDLPAVDFIKARASKVGDVMTKDVITVDETALVSDIAALLEHKSIKRVPVMRGSKLVGIISRANLVRLLPDAINSKEGSLEPSDRGLRDRVLDEISSTPYGSPWLLTVTVHKGDVTLWGPVHSDLERKTIRIAAEKTTGVRSVKDQLFQWPRSAA